MIGIEEKLHAARVTAATLGSHKRHMSCPQEVVFTILETGSPLVSREGKGFNVKLVQRGQHIECGNCLTVWRFDNPNAAFWAQAWTPIE